MEGEGREVKVRQVAPNYFKEVEGDCKEGGDCKDIGEVVREGENCGGCESDASESLTLSCQLCTRSLHPPSTLALFSPCLHGNICRPCLLKLLLNPTPPSSQGLKKCIYCRGLFNEVLLVRHKEKNTYIVVEIIKGTQNSQGIRE